MREPPKLAEAEIIAALHKHYGISTTALTFLPLGNDSATSVYRVHAADSATYFLKLRTGAGFNVPSLAVPRYLQDIGVPHLVAPLPTLTHTLWFSINASAASLYPFLAARTASVAGLSAQNWQAFGAMMKQIHASALPTDLIQRVPRETFIPSRRNLIADLENAVSVSDLADPAQRALAAFWHSRRDEIRTVVERSDTLASQLRQASAPLVLCHADMHTWNVLVSADREFWLVDWDETILALPERDLMFVVGGISSELVRPDDTAAFLQGYGNPTIDPFALAYYRYAWAVQDIASFAELVFFLPDFNEASRLEAVDYFMALFKPGGIVDIACASDIRSLQPTR